MHQSQEKVINVKNGFGMLFVNLMLGIGGVVCFIYSAVQLDRTHVENWGWGMGAGGLAVVSAIILLCGHFMLQPNAARVLLLFGAYKGTVRESGFFWTNPFYSKILISLRTRNFDGERLKVNDKRGNPVDISAVVVWKVVDTARALFDVDDYQNFVKVQSESALRNIATQYPYDHMEEDDETVITLRADSSAVNEALQKEVQERLSKAGVEVEEVRLNHLAYAQEIASAMLRRQQAEAIIAARKKIVHGAVTMVDMALTQLSEKKVIDFDPEAKAAMVSNLLVVLCGETEAQPVINTGTLHR
ncbi:MAG: SPFH domain-containing protein [Planctomycetes bacterium]|nr:SPFH domain-containing protein [Planctomycetota bacterium]